MHSNEIHLLFTTEFSFLNLLPVNPPLYSLPVSNGQKFLERYINICFSLAHLIFLSLTVLRWATTQLFQITSFFLGNQSPKRRAFSSYPIPIADLSTAF